MPAFINMCFYLIILNRLQRFPPLPLPKLPLISSQIYSIHRYSLPIQPSHHKQPTCHNIHPSLTHHHMHVYLTIVLQIQLVNQLPPPSCVTPSAGVGTTSGSSSAPPYLASVQATTDSTSACGRFSLSPFDYPRSCCWFLLLSAAAGHLMAIFFSYVAALNQQTPYGSSTVEAEDSQSDCFHYHCYCFPPGTTLSLFRTSCFLWCWQVYHLAWCYMKWDQGFAL